MKVILIDNYDSFTYNLVEILRKLECVVHVFHNDDQVLLRDRLFSDVDALFLGPGPGRPKEAGLCWKLLDRYHKLVPVFGLCLGHQLIVEYFGGSIDPVNEIIHGCSVKVHNIQTGLYKGLPSTFDCVRYNSLTANIDLPDVLSLTSWSVDKYNKKEVMGIQHHKYPIYGTQYHLESILSELGLEQVQNFLNNVTYNRASLRGDT